jgi:hypothetical protein
MKKFALGILLLCGTVTCVLAAQQQASVDRPAEPNFAFDDDGGKAQTGNEQAAELKQHSIKTLRAAPKLEDFSDLSQSKVNDLTIQQKLSDLLKSKAIPTPTAGTVFVIFLAPGIQSTLGGLQGGVDYAAYHNFVNLEVGEIHYVVVPFHENADTHSAAATRAFAETALNPNGQGWF